MCVHLQKHWPIRLYFLQARGIGDSDGDIILHIMMHLTLDFT